MGMLCTRHEGQAGVDGCVNGPPVSQTSAALVLGSAT